MDSTSGARLEGGYVRIILPEIGAGGADIGQEVARIAFVQIAHGGRQHDDVTGGLVITQDELAHPALLPARLAGESSHGVSFLNRL